MQPIHSHTALRGIAAIAVVWGHYTAVFAPHLFRPGTHLGVDLFFLLSGFILFRIYGAGFAGGVGRAAWGQFLLRRLARLWPLHLLTLAATVLLLRAGAGDLGQIVLNLLMIHAWGLTDRFDFNSPSWSISAEFGAYLLFPLLAWAAARARGRWLLLGLAAGASLLLWRAGGGSLDLDDTGRRIAWARVVAAFPVGMLLAWADARWPDLAGRGATALQGLALGAAGLAIGTGAPEMLLALCFLPLVLGTARDGGFLAPLLCRPLPIALGDISYGIYMIQWPVMLFMFHLRYRLFPDPAGQVGEVLAALIFVGLVLGLSVLSWHVLERPLIALARRRSRAAPDARD